MPDFPSRRDHLVAPGQKCAYQFPAEVLRGCKQAVLRAFAHMCDQGWQPAGSLQPGQSKRKALTWRAESPTTGGKWWFKRKSSFQRFCFLKGPDLLCWSKGCLALWGYHLNGSKTSFEKNPSHLRLMRHREGQFMLYLCCYYCFKADGQRAGSCMLAGTPWFFLLLKETFSYKDRIIYKTSLSFCRNFQN